jgi:hypothetical protein
MPLMVFACALCVHGARAQDSCAGQLGETLAARVSSGVLDDVKIVYEWRGGLGPGDLRAEMRGDGAGVLHLEPSNAPGEDRAVELPAARFEGIVRTVVQSEFLCLEPRPRQSCIGQMGRYSVTVSVGDLSREIWVDGYSAVAQDDVFASVVSAIRGLDDVFGREIQWSPSRVETIVCPER